MNTKELLDEIERPWRSNSLRVINWMAVFATGFMLYQCYMPGKSLWNVLGILLWLLTGICWLVGIIRLARNRVVAFSSAWLNVLTVPVLLFFSALGMTRIPEILGFQLSQQDLERLVRKAEASSEKAPEQAAVPGRDAPKEWAGLYPIFNRTVDDAGGVYLVTTVRRDGIGPDITSSGFAYKPSLERSPFGRKYYAPVRISGDWYTFEASDDY